MKRLLFRLARSRFASLFIGWSFAYMSWAIPVERLVETPSLMAFHHPVPSHKLHILIVPKRSHHNLATVPDSDFQRDLFVTVAKLVKDFALEQSNFQLICNGGSYQDVPQLHFHLISD
jgi:histidine triad (HIT) family protein